MVVKEAVGSWSKLRVSVMLACSLLTNQSGGSRKLQPQRHTPSCSDLIDTHSESLCLFVRTQRSALALLLHLLLSAPPCVSSLLRSCLVLSSSSSSTRCVFVSSSSFPPAVCLCLLRIFVGFSVCQSRNKMDDSPVLTGKDSWNVSLSLHLMCFGFSETMFSRSVT